MKIMIDDVRIRKITMERVDPNWRTASYAASSLDVYILEVVAGGTVGIGGTAAHPSSTPTGELEAQLHGPIMNALKGEDALAGNMIRKKLGMISLYSRARMAADLALHDLLGKITNLPCYALWGGALRRSIDVVRMVGIKPPAELERGVRELIEQGYRHLKVKIGRGDPREEAERIRIVRQAAGRNAWIGVDANGAFTPEEAIALSYSLEKYGVALIEQPVKYQDLDGLARVTAASAIPIMADQCVHDVVSALALCQRRAAHVVSLKVTKMGSLDECRRVAELCHAFGIRSHIGGSAGPAVVDAAQAQLAAAMPEIDGECEVGEFLALKENPFSGVTIREGQLELASAPGLGVSLTAL
jgi:L-Ala-D/L-Glu epimerase